MAAPDKNKSYLVNGRLAYGCADLTAAWPHGGTGLGLVGSIYWQPPSSYVELPAEEDGAPRAVLYTGGRGVLGASVEGWDDSVSGGVLAALFPNTSNNAGGTRKVVNWYGAPTTATPAVPVGGRFPELTNLVFTPTNVSEHPALVIYKAIVFLEASAQLRLGSYRYLSVPILALAVPDDDGLVASFGRLADLELP